MAADHSQTTLEALSVDLAPSAGTTLVLVLALSDGSVIEKPLAQDEPLTLGRAADAGIVVDDPSVSRHHAEINVGSKGPAVRDLGSRNGTWINEERIGTGFAAILPGDSFRFGGVAGAIHRAKHDDAGAAPEHE